MPVVKFEKDRDEKKLSRDMKRSDVDEMVITRTVSTPFEQARIMYDNIETKGIKNQQKLYGPNGDKVIDVYMKLKRQGKNRKEVIKTMNMEINRLGPRMVSRHCLKSAVLDVLDISPKSIPTEKRMAFEWEVRKEPRIIKILKPPKDPSISLRFLC